MAYLQDETVEMMARELDKAKGKLAEIKEKGAEAVREGMSIAEVGGTALALSYVNARYSADGVQYSLMGVPLDLGLAVLMHGFAWFGMFGKYDEDAHQVGTGALASYLARLGTQLGTSGRNAAQNAPGSGTTSGMFGTGYAPAGLPGGRPVGTQQFVVSEVPAGF